jgi:hypothetical protein
VAIINVGVSVVPCPVHEFDGDDIIGDINQHHGQTNCILYILEYFQLKKCVFSPANGSAHFGNLSLETATEAW